MGEGAQPTSQPLPDLLHTHSARERLLVSGMPPQHGTAGVPQPSGSGSSSFSRRWVEMTWWDLRLPAPLWALVSGPGLWGGAGVWGLATTSTLLSYPEATEETPHTDRQDPFIFSSIQPLLLLRASASSLSTSCSNQTASSDPGPANQSIPFLWPQ